MTTRLLPHRPCRPSPGPGGHPDWCARGHQCGLGEHRAAPVTLTVPGHGTVVLTRVLADDGRQHAEIRTRVTLVPGRERAHLAHVLAELDMHLRRVTRRPYRTT